MSEAQTVKPNEQDTKSANLSKPAKLPKLKILKKITLRDVAGTIKGNRERMAALIAGDELQFMDIYGVVNRIKADETPMGAFMRFYGQFKAINIETGASYRAGQAILPEIAATLLEGELGETVHEIQFALRIGAIYDEKSPVSYAYTVESLSEVAATDPIAALERELKGKLSHDVGTTPQLALANEPAPPVGVDTKKATVEISEKAKKVG